MQAQARDRFRAVAGLLAGAASAVLVLAAPVQAFELFGHRFFEKAPMQGRDMLSANQALRDLVSFRELNLIGDWPMRGKFDVIFCRNVVIYFDDATQEMVWSRFTPMMAPGATLYIGHSERVSGPATSQLQTAGLTTYRLGSA